MDYEIMLTTLEDKKAELDAQKSEVEGAIEGSTNSFHNMTGTPIEKLYEKIQNSTENVKTAYGKTSEWFDKYITELNELENSLANFTCNGVETPIEFKDDFIDIFGKKLMPTLKAGGDPKANTDLGELGGNLGATSGRLNNARIGEEGRPDYSGFYLREGEGGFNPFPLNGGGGGVGGNCTYYAYSRFSELMGEEATGLSKGDACSWWSASEGYKKGQEPRLGAIAVWQYGNSDSMGHVAVVEEIKDNGNLVVSQGGWSNCSWYNNKEVEAANNYALGYNDAHLLGFIYPEKE